MHVMVLNRRIILRPGSPWKMIRVRIFSGGQSQGFDFYSAYVMVNNAGPVKTFLAGDYRLQFGQGLTLWNGSAPGKSSLAMNIVKRQEGIRAFTSADENDLFRGAAATATAGKFRLTMFYSPGKGMQTSLIRWLQGLFVSLLSRKADITAPGPKLQMKNP